MTRDTYKQYHSIAALSLMILLFITGIVLMVLNGIQEMDKFDLFNAGYEIMPMIVSILLFFCCMLDGMQKAGEKKLFMALIFTNFITMFLDFIAYLIDGKAHLRLQISLIMLGLYAFTALMEWLLFEYFVGMMGLLEEKSVKLARKVTFVWWLFGEGLLLVNFLKPFLYYVNEAGKYVEMKWFGISSFFQIYVALALVIMAVHYRDRLRKNQILAVVLFGVSHLFLILLYVTMKKLFITSGVWVLVFLGLYMLINVENGNKGAVTEKELDTARNIQKSMLPKLFPDFVDVPEFEIYAVMNPAREVGGDFYDFFMLDEEHFVFLIGDVAGRGVGAALFMSVAKAMIAVRTKLGGTPAKILTDVNERLAESNEMAMFAGIWLGILNVKTGHLSFSNAGQSAPLILEREKGQEFIFQKNEAADPPVGAITGVTYQDGEADLKSGDRIFLYTDGVPDCLRQKMGDYFGTDRMVEILNANTDVSNETLCKRLMESVTGFLGDEDLMDDITLLGFTYKGA